MTQLSELTNTRPTVASRRVGRGVGRRGKTCGRGQKGAGSRSGYKRRLSYEGGQGRMFQKMPTRGFTRTAFLKRLDVINLGQISALFQEGEEVSLSTLREKGWISGPSYGIKVLGDGELSHKVTIRAQAMSASAREKCEKAGATVVLPE